MRLSTMVSLAMSRSSSAFNSKAKLEASGEKQISLADPDVRAMTSQSHSAFTVGYNVQSTVDTKHHLIVTHEVTNVGIDKDHLSPMAKQARDAVGAEKIRADNLSASTRPTMSVVPPGGNGTTN